MARLGADLTKLGQPWQTRVNIVQLGAKISLKSAKFGKTNTARIFSDILWAHILAFKSARRGSGGSGIACLFVCSTRSVLSCRLNQERCMDGQAESGALPRLLDHPCGKAYSPQDPPLPPMAPQRSHPCRLAHAREARAPVGRRLFARGRGPRAGKSRRFLPASCWHRRMWGAVTCRTRTVCEAFRKEVRAYFRNAGRLIAQIGPSPIEVGPLLPTPDRIRPKPSRKPSKWGRSRPTWASWG